MKLIPRRFTNRKCIGSPQGVGLALLLSVMVFAVTVMMAIQQWP